MIFFVIQKAALYSTYNTYNTFNTLVFTKQPCCYRRSQSPSWPREQDHI
jgi:hypothetical protein